MAFAAVLYADMYSYVYKFITALCRRVHILFMLFAVGMFIHMYGTDVCICIVCMFVHSCMIQLVSIL